uniref:Cytochrome b5 heme-binding domain-containing protein n=1 Tax=Heliothis virescens TaxID=7102 RepID=A0A2A4JJE5_HELVI
MAAQFTRKEVEARNQRDNAAIIIDNVVYDVTPFFDDHPGGVEVLLDNAGKDASQCFHDVGHSEIALEWRQQFVAGEVVPEEHWPVRARDQAAQQAAEPLTLAALLSVWGPPLVLAALAALFYMYLFP